MVFLKYLIIYIISILSAVLLITSPLIALKGLWVAFLIFGIPTAFAVTIIPYLIFLWHRKRYGLYESKHYFAYGLFMPIGVYIFGLKQYFDKQETGTIFLIILFAIAGVIIAMLHRWLEKKFKLIEQ